MDRLFFFSKGVRTIEYRKGYNLLAGREYLQTEQVCSIGSGSIESTIKRSSSERGTRSWNEPKQQIDRRTQISGAQWKSENIPQVLAHRCAYLNGLICDRLAARLRSR